MKFTRSNCEFEAAGLLQEQEYDNYSSSHSYQHGLPMNKKKFDNKNGFLSTPMRKKIVVVSFFVAFVLLMVTKSQHNQHPNNSNSVRNYTDKKYFHSLLKEAWSIDTVPLLSESSPNSVGYPAVNRYAGKPGPAFIKLLSQGTGEIGNRLPTNRWYQNLLMGSPRDEFGRVYTIPYIVDTAGSIVGLRIYYPRVQASASIVQMVFESEHGITIGTEDPKISHQYIIDEISEPSELGVALKWFEDGDVSGDRFMISPLSRGMPYATMLFSSGITPVVQSVDLPASPLLIDGETSLNCDGSLKRVKDDVSIHFQESDFTYLVFVSSQNPIVHYIFKYNLHLCFVRLKL